MNKCKSCGLEFHGYGLADGDVFYAVTVCQPCVYLAVVRTLQSPAPSQDDVEEARVLLAILRCNPPYQRFEEELAMLEAIAKGGRRAAAAC